VKLAPPKRGDVQQDAKTGRGRHTPWPGDAQDPDLEPALARPEGAAARRPPGRVAREPGAASADLGQEAQRRGALGIRQEGRPDAQGRAAQVMRAAVDPRLSEPGLHPPADADQDRQEGVTSTGPGP
jgi:hypothetical protein